MNVTKGDVLAWSMRRSLLAQGWPEHGIADHYGTPWYDSLTVTEEMFRQIVTVGRITFEGEPYVVSGVQYDSYEYRKTVYLEPA